MKKDKNPFTIHRTPATSGEEEDWSDHDAEWEQMKQLFYQLQRRYGELWQSLVLDKQRMNASNDEIPASLWETSVEAGSLSMPPSNSSFPLLVVVAPTQHRTFVLSNARKDYEADERETTLEISAVADENADEQHEQKQLYWSQLSTLNKTHIARDFMPLLDNVESQNHKNDKASTHASLEALSNTSLVAPLSRHDKSSLKAHNKSLCQDDSDVSYNGDSTIGSSIPLTLHKLRSKSDDSDSSNSDENENEDENIYTICGRKSPRTRNSTRKHSKLCLAFSDSDSSEVISVASTLIIAESELGQPKARYSIKAREVDVDTSTYENDNDNESSSELSLCANTLIDDSFNQSAASGNEEVVYSVDSSEGEDEEEQDRIEILVSSSRDSLTSRSPRSHNVFDGETLSCDELSVELIDDHKKKQIHRSSESLLKLKTKNRNRSTIRQQLESMTQILFMEYDRIVFHGILSKPGVCTIKWSKRLLTTAGITRLPRHSRTATIELSCKLLTEESRLRCTLMHELCHAAAWIIDGYVKPPHGPVFRKWSNRAAQLIPGMHVTTTHNYAVPIKYSWQCQNASCGKVYGRVKRSIDVRRHKCGCCNEGRLVEITSASLEQTGARNTDKPKTPLSEDQQFVKAQHSTNRRQLEDTENLCPLSTTSDMNTWRIKSTSSQCDKKMRSSVTSTQNKQHLQTKCKLLLNKRLA